MTPTRDHVWQRAVVLAALLGGCGSPAVPPSNAPVSRVEPSVAGGARIEPSIVSPDVLFGGGSSLEIVSGTSSCPSKAPVFVDILVSASEARPGVLVEREGSWSVLSFDHEDYAQNGWAFVSATADCQQLAAVADCRVESPGWELAFVLSRDRGQSFRRVGTLKKPYYMAQVSAFAVDERGSGKLTITLDDDYGAGVTPGLYHYETHDFGATWSSPRVAPLTGPLPAADSSPTRLSSRADLERFKAAPSR